MNASTMPSSSTFCPLPFFQVVVRTDGSMSPCCAMKGTAIANIKNSSILEFWESAALKKIKNQMIIGASKVNECEQCYNDERDVGQSMRTDALQKYKFLNDRMYSKLINHYGYLNKKAPTWLEMHLSNICNLKCLTCRPEDSSMFLQENRVIGISNHVQSDYKLDKNIVDYNINLIIDHLDVLDLRGGESLLIPSIKQKLKEISPEKCADKMLRIQTNGTILDDTWKTIFNKFRSVEIMLSVDAHGEDNAYIRFPADWDTIEKNVDYFNSAGHKLSINCTVSNLNFLILDKLLAWANKKEIYFHYALLKDPDYYHFSNLPKSVLDKAKKKLADWVTVYPAISGLLSVVSNTDKWNTFCKMIDKRDLYRKNSIFKILPELKDHWNA